MERDFHKDKGSFIIYKEWEEFVRELPTDSDRGKLFMALFEYSITGEQPKDFTGELKMVFLMMRNAMDRDGQKWERICETRSSNGKKGGAPAGNQNAKQAKQANGCLNNQNNQMVEKTSKTTENNLKQAKQAVYEYENEYVYEYENEKEKEKENEYVDFSTVELSDEQLASLVSFSSRPVVEIFISKAREWQIKNKRKYKDPFKTIKGWIEEDQKKNNPKNEITIEELAGNHLIPL